METREYESARRVRTGAKPQALPAVGFAKRKRLKATGPKAWWQTVTHFVPKPWRPARYPQELTTSFRS